MKFVLFRVHLVTEGADSSQPFLSPMSGSLRFLLPLLEAGAHVAGEDEQLGVPTAFGLRSCDVVAASVLAGVGAASALELAAVPSASFFCL